MEKTLNSGTEQEIWSIRKEMVYSMRQLIRFIEEYKVWKELRENKEGAITQARRNKGNQDLLECRERGLLTGENCLTGYLAQAE